MSVDKAGTSVTVLAPNRLHPIGLGVDDAYVYFTEGIDFLGGPQSPGLYRIPKDGGGVETLETDDAGFGYGYLAIQGTTAFTEAVHPVFSPHLRRSDLTGQLPACSVYVANSRGRILLVVVAGSVVVFAHGLDNLTDAGALYQTSAQCGAGASLLGAVSNLRGMTGDDGSVYFTDDHGMFRQDLGGAASPFSIQSGNFPHAIVTVADSVVYSSQASGGIFRVAKSGGSSVTLLPNGPQFPRRFALDSDGILYWTNTNSGEIVKLALPP
jgi:hypothetical protein